MHPLVKARKILDIVYARANASLPIHVPWIVDALEQLTDFDRLAWAEFNSSAPLAEREFRGIFLPREDAVNGRISKVGVALVPRGIDQKERNLVVVKELTHSLDPKGQFSCTPEQLDDMIAPLAMDPPLLGLDVHTASAADVYGVYAAIETLVPFEIRPWVYPNKSVAELSDIFQVPERTIRTTMNPLYQQRITCWVDEFGIVATMCVDAVY